MKVSTLQQYLRNLIAPLQASAASAQSVAALERACVGFDPFRDKDVTEFAEFLTRGANYERDGKWPSAKPSISGGIVDEPSPHEYAQRLRTFLERTTPMGTPLTTEVKAELDRLTKRLNTQQLQEMARELQIEDKFRSIKDGIDKIVARLTGQPRSEKTPSRRGKTADDPALIQQYADELRSLAGSDRLEQRLNEMTTKLSIPKLKELAERLGATRTGGNKKAKWAEIILETLNVARSDGHGSTPAHSGNVQTPQATTGTATGGQPHDSSLQNSKITRMTEIVAALKTKADGPDAPFDEIEAELQSLTQQMDRDEAIAVAKRIGVVRHVTTRAEAIEEIRRKVFEQKRARESIAY